MTSKMMHIRRYFPVVMLGLTLAVLAACSSEEPANDEAIVDNDRKKVLAPIDAAELMVSDSMPPVYEVAIQSGLPSGCAEFDRIDIARDSRRIDLTVWNTMPADENIPCTMIYGTAQNTVVLGDDFEPGERYEIRINKETELSFTAR